MGKKIIISFISVIFSIIIFAGSVAFLSLYDISHGIKKENILEIIDDVDIEEELKQFEVYNKLEKEDKKLIRTVFENEEIETCIKETVGNIYVGIIYDEKINIEEEKLTKLINNKIEEIQEKYGMTEENIETIKNITKQIEKEINEIEKIRVEHAPQIDAIKLIFSKKASYYPLILVIVLSAVVILINEKYKGLIWASIPVIVSGALFLLISLSIDGTIRIDGSVSSLAMESMDNLIKTIKISSIVYIVIGVIEIGIYEISKLKENGVTYGENQSI